MTITEGVRLIPSLGNVTSSALDGGDGGRDGGGPLSALRQPLKICEDQKPLGAPSSRCAVYFRVASAGVGPMLEGEMDDEVDDWRPERPEDSPSKS